MDIVVGFGPIPPGLLAASNAAKDGKAPGKLTIGLAIALPSESAAATVLEGSVHADGSCVILGPRVRKLLSREQVKALRVRNCKARNV